MSEEALTSRGCIRLLGAIVREWVRDARNSNDELQALAEFVEQPPDSLRCRLVGLRWAKGRNYAD